MNDGTTRRELLRRGAGYAAAGGALGLLPATSAYARSRPRWPRRALRARDAISVDPSQFLGVRQLREWVDQLDDRGLRATGSRVHHQHIDSLAARLERVGVRHVHTEPVPLDRWAPSSWSLEAEGVGRLPVAAYIPYSGQTGPEGVAATLLSASVGGLLDTAITTVDDLLAALAQDTTRPHAKASDSRLALLSGKIVLFDVLPLPLVDGVFDALDWGHPTHAPGYSPLTPYNRLWIAQTPLQDELDLFSTIGAAGAIGILDLPAEAAAGMYIPYDADLRNLPGVFVDRDTGALLRKLAGEGKQVRLTLEAKVERITTPNLVGMIPGSSEELVILECHTDGTNGLEDNGPEAILAICQYLARLPREALPRTVLVALCTGHFAGGALGSSTFVSDHADDLIPRAAAALTIEHLGAREWLPGPGGNYELTGRYELGGAFASPYSAVVDLVRSTLLRARVTEDRVMRPFIPAIGSRELLTWPGDGEPFWAGAGLPATNFLTGPTYLLNGGMRVAKMIDIHAMRRQAIAFTELIAQLTRAPLAALKHHDLIG